LGHLHRCLPNAVWRGLAARPIPTKVKLWEAGFGRFDVTNDDYSKSDLG
jgi:hypothetical protein